MKYRIIASVVIIVLIILAIALRHSSSEPAVDENGNPVQQTEQPQQQ